MLTLLRGFLFVIPRSVDSLSNKNNNSVLLEKIIKNEKTLNLENVTQNFKKVKKSSSEKRTSFKNFTFERGGADPVDAFDLNNLETFKTRQKYKPTKPRALAELELNRNGESDSLDDSENEQDQFYEKTLEQLLKECAKIEKEEKLNNSGTIVGLYKGIKYYITENQTRNKYYHAYLFNRVEPKTFSSKYAQLLEENERKVYLSDNKIVPRSYVKKYQLKLRLFMMSKSVFVIDGTFGKNQEFARYFLDPTTGHVLFFRKSASGQFNYWSSYKLSQVQLNKFLLTRHLGVH